MRATRPTHHTLFDFFTILCIYQSVGYKSQSVCRPTFLQPPVTSYRLFSSALCSQIPPPVLTLGWETKFHVHVKEYVQSVLYILMFTFYLGDKETGSELNCKKRSSNLICFYLRHEKYFWFDTAVLTVVAMVTKTKTNQYNDNHLSTGVEPTPETSCVSNIHQTMDNVQHSVPIMNQPLSQIFRESPLKRRSISTRLHPSLD
jgi:hypothetical protein